VKNDEKKVFVPASDILQETESAPFRAKQVGAECGIYSIANLLPSIQKLYDLGDDANEGAVQAEIERFGYTTGYIVVGWDEEKKEKKEKEDGLFDANLLEQVSRGNYDEFKSMDDPKSCGAILRLQNATRKLNDGHYVALRYFKKKKWFLIDSLSDTSTELGDTLPVYDTFMKKMGEPDALKPYIYIYSIIWVKGCDDSK
jgi:hypothetical protein